MDLKHFYTATRLEMKLQLVLNVFRFDMRGIVHFEYLPG